MSLLLAAKSSHQTQRNHKKLTSSGFKQQPICTPLAPTRNKIIYKTACSDGPNSGSGKPSQNQLRSKGPPQYNCTFCQNWLRRKNQGVTGNSCKRLYIVSSRHGWRENKRKKPKNHEATPEGTMRKPGIPQPGFVRSHDANIGITTHS